MQSNLKQLLIFFHLTLSFPYNASKSALISLLCGVDWDCKLELRSSDVDTIPLLVIVVDDGIRLWLWWWDAVDDVVEEEELTSGVSLDFTGAGDDIDLPDADDRSEVISFEDWRRGRRCLKDSKMSTNTQ